MSHYTSEARLFTADDRERSAMTVACDALLIALQREHPQIVRHLQERAAARTEPCTA